MFNLKEAIKEAEKNGLKVDRKAIAAKLWAKGSKESQRISLLGLEKGLRPSIKIEWIPYLCKMLGCDANFLFGIKTKKRDEQKESIETNNNSCSVSDSD